MKTYLMVKKDYENRKNNYNFVVKDYGKKRRLLFGHNQILDGIIGYLDKTIDETDFIIDMVNQFELSHHKDMMFNASFRDIVEAAKGVVERTSNLISGTLKDIYSDDPMSLEGIREKARKGVIGLMCEATRIHSGIKKVTDN